MNWPNRTNTHLARDLRNNATDAERKLWCALSARKVGGTRFNRQVCIGPYICDFVARTPRLIIEVDGGQHTECVQDDKRTQFLLSQGYQVVRFWNHDVLDNIDGVVADIERLLPTLPQPLPQAGGEPAAFGAEVGP
jgi:very-short-patch-repair endonuclease